MNATIEAFTRAQILDGLEQLPKEWQRTFKLMYMPRASKNGLPQAITEEEIEACLIEQLVNTMPTEKLDWALSQVENSLKKLN